MAVVMLVLLGLVALYFPSISQENWILSLVVLAIIGFFVNSLLAMFNMLPFGIFDGRKVMAWNKTVFYIMFMASIALFFFSQQFIINYQKREGNLRNIIKRARRKC